MFEPAEPTRLAPRARARAGSAAAAGTSASGAAAIAELAGNPGLVGNAGLAGLDPLSGTETLAYDFLSQGGKHSRPFITLAVHDALTGAHATRAEGAEYLAQLSPSIKRVAMSIETFHKASLVHDDIEDDDQFRYGSATLHRRFGIPTAINVGDYLIGMGYRLVSREAAALGPAAAVDILDRLADAHLKLSEGQGAELLWRDGGDKRLTPLDALKIYALKTAPAFEAALYSGLRLAGDTVVGTAADTAGSAVGSADFVAPFSRHLGVAFQILNDLKDWSTDDDNKLLAAGDVLGGRPTVLWALALENLPDDQRAELETLVAQRPLSVAAVERVRQLYVAAGVFEKATRLVDKYQERAEGVADQVEPEELRRLLYYLVDSVLERTVLDRSVLERPDQDRSAARQPLVSLQLPTSRDVSSTPASSAANA